MNPLSFQLDQIIREIGQAGRRLSEIDASEASAGNLSVCMRGAMDIAPQFSQTEIIELPMAVPSLAGSTVIVSGSGRRLREIAEFPNANLACVVVQEGGQFGRMFTSANRRFRRVTSEFNTHLALHEHRMKSGNTALQCVLHAQPLHLTYLSHISRYQDERHLNRRLLRWQAETILNMPEGIGVLPFMLPGSDELMRETVRSMRAHQIVLWARHGVVARSDDSVLGALDLIEYAETAARYEYLNLVAGERSEGLSPAEIREICRAWNVQQDIF